jgi:hypothetical protein
MRILFPFFLPAMAGALILSMGCGGGGNGNASAAAPVSTPTVVISAPTLVTEADRGVASATEVAGATYSWSIRNGTITAGSGTRTVSFQVGTPGTASLSVSVSGGTATASMDVLPRPSIDSFQAAAATISKGTSTQLTADFANGTGSIQPGNLPIASGTAITSDLNKAQHPEISNI